MTGCNFEMNDHKTAAFLDKLTCDSFSLFGFLQRKTPDVLECRWRGLYAQSKERQDERLWQSVFTLQTTLDRCSCFRKWTERTIPLSHFIWSCCLHTHTNTQNGFSLVSQKSILSALNSQTPPLCSGRRRYFSKLNIKLIHFKCCDVSFISYLYV